MYIYVHIRFFINHHSKALVSKQKIKKLKKKTTTKTTKKKPQATYKKKNSFNWETKQKVFDMILTDVSQMKE